MKLSAFITAMSNFSVQYNFQSIAIALLVMSVSVCSSTPANCLIGIQSSWVYGTSTAISFIGAITGQLSMGYLGDVIGRNKALKFTNALAAISALLSGIASQGNPTSIYGIIIVFRFFLGVGCGGVFPLAATKASEDSGRDLGQEIDPLASSWAFFWQMPGLLAPWLLGYILASANLNPETQWRLLLSLGCIPSSIAMVGLIIEERINNASLLTNSSSSSEKTKGNSSPHVFEALKVKKYRHYMIACGLTWFLFDIVVYGVGLIGAKILDVISKSTNVSSSSSIQLVASQQMVAMVLGIPATLIAIYMMPFMGLKWLQFFSFLFMAAWLLIFACVLNPFIEQNNTTALFAIFCIVGFSYQSGVNITTYSLPAALYPKDIRSSLNGIASAIGKAGAVVGGFSLLPIAQASGSYTTVLAIGCVVSVLGAIVTFYFVDDVQITDSTKTALTEARQNSLAGIESVRLSLQLPMQSMQKMSERMSETSFGRTMSFTVFNERNGNETMIP